jgi:hypothetical protein
MKVLFSLFAAIIVVTSFTSCNRNYTCECKNNINGEVIIGNIMSQSAKEARKHCKMSDDVTAQYFTCDIK